MSDLKPGIETEVTITSLAHGGSGVGRVGDFVLFVPFSAPGDRIKAKILNIKKNYAEGEIISILEPSPHRIKPPCPVYGFCGGCQWQHVSYSEQLKQKQLIVCHALQRIAKIENVLVEDVVPSPKQLNYRNRIQIRTDGSQVGFYKKQSHNLVELNECLIAEENINELILELKKKVKDNPPGKTFRLELSSQETPARGFTQVNTGQNEKIQNFVAELFGAPEQVDRDNKGSKGNLLDLYCGDGNFSFPLNKKGWRIYGVDLSRASISAARKRANADTFFSCADGSLEAKKLAAKGRIFEAVLLDPPRTGADERLWESLVKLSPEIIVYVSCDPATFARDWARLKSKGAYSLVRVTPFDMFPQTHHVELVAVARRSR